MHGCQGMLIYTQDGHFDLHVSLSRGDELLTKGGWSHPRVNNVNVMWRSAACLFVHLSMLQGHEPIVFFSLSFSSIPIISLPSRKPSDQHSSAHNPLSTLDRCVTLLWVKKRQPPFLTGTCSASTSWNWMLCGKGYSFFILSKPFLCFCASKLCFYLHLWAQKCTPWLILSNTGCQI